MKRSGLLIFVGLTAALVIGCKHRDNEVIGRWKNPSGTVYTFNENNTFTRANKVGNATGTWSVNGNKIVTSVEKVNQESYKDKTEKTFKEAKSFLPPDFVTLHSKAEFELSPDGHTLMHKNSTTGKDVPYTKQ